MINLGLTHGVGNAAVLLPRDNFLFAADFLSPGRLPFGIAPDYNFDAWMKNLEKFLMLDWDKAIHTHTGREDPLQVSTKEDMEQGLQYLQVPSVKRPGPEIICACLGNRILDLSHCFEKLTFCVSTALEFTFSKKMCCNRYEGIFGPWLEPVNCTT